MREGYRAGLTSRLIEAWEGPPLVGRVRQVSQCHWAIEGLRAGNLVRLANLSGRRSHVVRSRRAAGTTPTGVVGPSPRLRDGDIVRVDPADHSLWLMYRKESEHNQLFLTGRCNCRCIMCSQPPSRRDDSWLARAWRDAIPLVSPDTRDLGITGGEPTLLGDAFIDIVALCRQVLPETSIHVLSNARLFAYLSLASALASVEHPRLMVGVPLHSDLSSQHDWIAGAAGAFDQTVRGMLNLARCGVDVEVRVVVQRGNHVRLPSIARFIARNLPFAAHVAFMGLEHTGLCLGRWDDVWVDPMEYQSALAEAVHHLDRRGLAVSIYNEQLCVLDRSLWPYARKSISDWKQAYLPSCEPCSAQARCGGFFTWNTSRPSALVRPLC